jgi:TRAP-type C4-dicarboxylate transport system substrate-binding protein
VRLVWPLIPALAILAVGCSGGTKAGGKGRSHTAVLTIANHDGEGRDLGEYVAAVGRLSAGSVRLRIRNDWRAHEVDYDRGTVADLRAGKVDLAKISVRSFDTLGDGDFRALTAPFLVDSLGLEQETLESSLPDEMLAGVKALGVVGVAMLPGDPRRPFGQRRQFLSPSDYRGASFGTLPSRVSAATLRALGAQPRRYPAGDLPYSLDGAELDLRTIEEAGYDTKVTSLTTNVVFWPRAFVIVVNKKVFESLTPEQREALRRAGSEALAPAVSRLRTKDLDEAGILCRRGQSTFVKATPAQLAGLRAAVRPVYAALERDPKARSLLSAIESMKRRSPPAPPVQCGRSTSPSRAVTPLEGTWEMTASPAHGIDSGRYLLVLNHGRWLFRHLTPPKWGGPGAFVVRGDKLEVRFSDGGDAVYRWNVYRGKLTLQYTAEKVGPPDPTFAPWYRVQS